MKTEEEIKRDLSEYTSKLKPNPNDFIIINKWNTRIFNLYKYKLFDYISKYIDEAIIEMLKERPCCYVSINDVNPKFQVLDIDEDKHLWYNTFNKWNWTKFKNGVIKIADNDNR